MNAQDKKLSRIFYLTLAVILTVTAVIIIAVSVARRNQPTQNTDTPSSILNSNDDTSTGAEENEDNLTLALPLENCTLDIDYSDTVLVFSPTMEDYRAHFGVDLRGEIGQEVMAVADGVVKNIWQDPFMGTCVSIEHDKNVVSYYKNLDPVVKEGLVIGASVSKGDVIGAIGESAMNEVAQDPHLHFELMIKDKHVDPKDHIKLPTPELPPEETPEQK